MGSSKETTKTESTQQQTQKVTPTAEETRLNQLLLERTEAAQGGTIQAQESGLSLINALLTGSNLPGFLQGLPGGISPELTSEIAGQAVEDIRPSFQTSGILDSGVAAEISGRVAGDIRRGSAEFNINNLLNLLSVGIGGQAQIQQPLIQQSALLGGQLAGLRGIQTTGTSTGRTTTFGMNPFLKSFQTSLGQSFGSGSFGSGGASAKDVAGVAGGCWVAAEIFGGWNKPKTCSARYFINTMAPKWFKEFYLSYGKRIAYFINNKPVFKVMLRSMFEVFAELGRRAQWQTVI